ncbi:MAG: hypothetical protein WC378_02865 [Opitutaceae bacterium]|jgi:hypothetical protein
MTMFASRMADSEQPGKIARLNLAVDFVPCLIFFGIIFWLVF